MTILTVLSERRLIPAGQQAYSGRLDIAAAAAEPAATVSVSQLTTLSGLTSR